MAELVTLASIDVADEAWPRHAINEDRVNEFLELYQSDGLTALPPLTLIRVGDRWLLADGRHRGEALRRLGAAEALVVELDVRGRAAETVAFEEAVRSAAAQSLPLTRDEKRAAIERFLVEGGRTDREIGRLVGVAHTTVARVRDRSGERIGREADDGPIEYRPEPSADELARALVRGCARLWDRRGLSDLILGDRMGNRLAAALEDRFGDDALDWARRLDRWISDAQRRLQRGPDG